MWRAETDRGRYWAKDNCRGQRHEASLLVRLAELAPHRVLPVTAAEPETGLLLTPDRGAPLGRLREVDTDTWCRVVVAHAGLQRDVAPHLETLGLTRLAAADAVTHVERLVTALRGYPDGDPRRLTDEQARAVEATLPDVALWGEQVAALGLPVTIDHNDLHPHNVFEVDGRLELFDFGDAVALEPLAALRVPLASAAADGLDLTRIVDAGIEAWSDVAPAADLRAALPASLQLGVLGRAESWLRCAADMSEVEVAEFGDSAAAWLVRLAEDPPLDPPPRVRNHEGGARRLS